MPVLFIATVNADGISQLGRVSQGRSPIRHGAGSKGQTLFQSCLAGQAGDGNFLPHRIRRTGHGELHIPVGIHGISSIGTGRRVFHQMVIHVGQTGQIYIHAGTVVFVQGQGGCSRCSPIICRSGCRKNTAPVYIIVVETGNIHRIFVPFCQCHFHGTGIIRIIGG